MTYAGAKIPKDVAQVYMDRAFLYLKRITLNRIEPLSDERDIMIAVSAVAEVFYAHTERGNITSENNDGFSVSYRDTDMHTEAYKTALQYLPPGMLYRGMQVVGDGAC